MKVLEHGECYAYGSSGKIRCNCNCLFKYDKDDIQERGIISMARDPKDDKLGVETFVTCPECLNEIVLNREW